MRMADLLSRGHLPLLADGAFGTHFRGLTHSDSPPELANLGQPDVVSDIHRGYLEAGAVVLYSNTFAANFQLTTDEQYLRQIIKAGLSLAYQAAGDKAAVLADIGPMDFRAASNEDEAAEAYLRLTQIFCSAGARDFVFETMPGFADLLPSLQYIREVQPDAFVLVTFAVSQDGYSNKGLYYKELLDIAFASGIIDAAGLNCLCGPAHMARLLAAYDAHGHKLAALPNAGYPTQVNNRLVYEDNIDYYAQRLMELAGLGCFMVGGCCGTGPAHIAQAAKMLRAESPLPPALRATPLGEGGESVGLAKNAAALSVGEGFSDTTVRSSKAPPPEELSGTQLAEGRTERTAGFANKLAQKQTAVVVELNPPISTDVEHFVAAARLAAAAGADIISVTDSPLARVRADSLMLAAKLQRELGIETLPHLSCRDRNRLGLQAALLGAAIEGIRYVLAVRGDAAEGAVFSLNSRQLISFIRSLNRELLADNALMCGGALNVNAPNFAAELKRALAKEEAGCSFFLTQPVLDESGLEHTAQAAQTLSTPVLAGILPLAGYKNALFMQQEVAGINIPETLLNSLKNVDAAEARNLSLEHCRRMMRELAGCCAGYYLSTPLNRIDMACELTEYAQNLRRPPNPSSSANIFSSRGLA